VRGDQAKRPGPLSRFAARSQRVERREAKLAKAAEAAHGHAVDVRTDAPVCPRCAGPARIDINDRTRGVLHLSCDSCFKMWQVREADAREHDGRSLPV
jgi:transposase-like protein